jgi:class 3 adenylate cyclase
MSLELGFPLLDDPYELAPFQGWSKTVYADLLAVERGRMSDTGFDTKYLTTKAILVLDVTGFTVTSIHGGAMSSFLRILDAHKVCFPVLQEHGATFIRAFADDVVALFDDSSAALDASVEIHVQTNLYNRSGERHDTPPECCIGIGYGSIYEIGPSHAMGDEMNRASVLGGGHRRRGRDSGHGERLPRLVGDPGWSSGIAGQ